jgi:hypothetical protein
MGEWHVIVGDIIEEMDLVFLEHQSSCDRVYWCVAPSFVEKATGVVERVEVIDVCLGAQPV